MQWLVCFAVALVFVAGCRFAPRTDEGDPVGEARAAYEASVEGAPAAEIAATALDYAGQSDVPADERVRALGTALKLTSESQALPEMESLVGPLDAALNDLAALPPDPQHGIAEMEAEIGLRLAHRKALGAWSGGQKEQAERILDQAFDVYQRHFSLSVEYSQVLWDRAELLRRAGRQEDALEAYHRVVAEGGEYGDKAERTIVSIWTVASERTPLPSDVEARQQIPSPHSEWIAIAQQRIEADPTSAEARQYLLRIADLQLAYKQTGEGYATLRRVIADADDAYSVTAASTLLTHVADSNPSRREFRLVRKELQKNKFLWDDREFRVLVFGLKDRIEGK